MGFEFIGLRETGDDAKGVGLGDVTASPSNMLEACAFYAAFLEGFVRKHVFAAIGEEPPTVKEAEDEVEPVHVSGKLD